MGVGCKLMRETRRRRPDRATRSAGQSAAAILMAPHRSEKPAPQAVSPLRIRRQYLHLVQVPARARLRPLLPQAPGDGRPELQHPAPDRLVGHLEPALREQVFDIAVAERETRVEPDRVLDDHRRKLVAGVGDRRHRPSLRGRCASSVRSRDDAHRTAALEGQMRHVRLRPLNSTNTFSRSSATILHAGARACRFEPQLKTARPSSGSA